MERRPDCPICASTSGIEAFRTPYDAPIVRRFLNSYYDGRVNHSYIDDEDLVIRYCEDCSVYWHEWILDDEGMFELYEHWGSATESKEKRNDWGRRQRYITTASYVPNCVDKPPHEVQVLDYGMGWGSFLLAVQAYGCQVTGLELSPVRQEYAAERGIETVEDLDNVNTSFDVAALHQTLEHVPNPRRTLATVADNLNSGGYIHVTVPKATEPTAESVFAKGPFQPPEHINAFSREALLTLADDLGLEVTSPSPSLLPLERATNIRGIAKAFLELTGGMTRVKQLRGDTDVFFCKP